jgi:hypothetical protein
MRKPKNKTKRSASPKEKVIKKPKGKNQKPKFGKAATMTFDDTQHPIIDDSLSPRNNGARTPPES